MRVGYALLKVWPLAGFHARHPYTGADLFICQDVLTQGCQASPSQLLRASAPQSRPSALQLLFLLPHYRLRVVTLLCWSSSPKRRWKPSTLVSPGCSPRTRELAQCASTSMLGSPAPTAGEAVAVVHVCNLGLVGGVPELTAQLARLNWWAPGSSVITLWPP